MLKNYLVLGAKIVRPGLFKFLSGSAFILSNFSVNVFSKKIKCVGSQDMYSERLICESCDSGNICYVWFFTLWVQDCTGVLRVVARINDAVCCVSLRFLIKKFKFEVNLLFLGNSFGSSM